MNNPFKPLLHFLFPKHCAICDTIIPHNISICSECEAEIEPFEGKICRRCGHKVKHCECKRFVYHFRGIVAPFANDGVAQKGIYGLKLIPNYDAAEYFAAAMVDKIKEVFADVDFEVVTAVPMHGRKRRKVGFDHAELLAKTVAKGLGLPYKPILKKQKKNKPQHSLTSKERFSNVKGVFSAKNNNYANVLLIDDIKTTGATLDECARVLMLAGAENVYCATAVISTCKDE